MNEEIPFIKDEEEYNRIKSLRPVNNYKNKKYRFICSKCGKETIKQLLSIKYPFICRHCNLIYAMQDQTCINKRKETCIKKYGVDNPWKNKSVQEKRKETWLNNYGTDNPQKNSIIRKNRNNTEQLHLIEKYNNIIDETILTYNYNNFICKCNICKNIFSINKDLFYTRVINHKTKVCIFCNPINNTGSGKQILLNNYIKSIYNGLIEYNNINVLPNHKELDIYLPELKLGFEFDGTYWHADPRFYNADDIIEHKNITAKEIWERDKQKELMCEQLNIKLIRIKEYDWINDNENIKQYISDIIKNQIKIIN